MLILLRRTLTLRGASKRFTAYERAEVLLARSGCRRARHQTPLEFLEGVIAGRPDLAPSRALALLHYAQRYSGAPLSAEESRRAEELLGKVRLRLDAARKRNGR